jgi:hypothetical protein
LRKGGHASTGREAGRAIFQCGLLIANCIFDIMRRMFYLLLFAMLGFLTVDKAEDSSKCHRFSFKQLPQKQNGIHQYSFLARNESEEGEFQNVISTETNTNLVRDIGINLISAFTSTAIVPCNGNISATSRLYFSKKYLTQLYPTHNFW